MRSGTVKRELYTRVNEVVFYKEVRKTVSQKWLHVNEEHERVERHENGSAQPVERVCHYVPHFPRARGARCFFFAKSFSYFSPTSLFQGRKK